MLDAGNLEITAFYTGIGSICKKTRPAKQNIDTPKKVSRDRQRCTTVVAEHVQTANAQQILSHESVND
jgi:hypothetical protein